MSFMWNWLDSKSNEKLHCIDFPGKQNLVGTCSSNLVPNLSTLLTDSGTYCTECALMAIRDRSEFMTWGEVEVLLYYIIIILKLKVWSTAMAQHVETTTILNAQPFWTRLEMHSKESLDKQTNTQTNGRYQTYYLPCFAVDNYRQYTCIMYCYLLSVTVQSWNFGLNF